MEREPEIQSLQLLSELRPQASTGEADAEPSEPLEEITWNWSDSFALDIARATRTWIQYGMVGFAVACIVIGAVKGVLGL